MIAVSSLGDNSFPKSARLRKSRDFQFRPYKRFHTENFNFLYTSRGYGRLGISISKKVLKRAIARNRIRRLLKEAFRMKTGAFDGYDIHIVAQPPLHQAWTDLKCQDMEGLFQRFLDQAVVPSASGPRNA